MKTSFEYDIFIRYSQMIAQPRNGCKRLFKGTN